MRRLTWLFEDAVTRSPLPLIPHQTRLELLGFFMPYDGQLPGPVAMLARHAGRLYQMTATGEAYHHRVHPREDAPVPDLPAPAGVSICVGESAYAVDRDKILFGPHWKLRKELKLLRDSPQLCPIIATRIEAYLGHQAQQVLSARGYARKTESVVMADRKHAGPNIYL